MGVGVGKGVGVGVGTGVGDGVGVGASVGAGVSVAVGSELTHPKEMAATRTITPRIKRYLMYDFLSGYEIPYSVPTEIAIVLSI